MDSIGMCQRTIDAAGEMIASVRAGELAKPTPCSAWQVRALINHMTAGNYVFAEALAGTKPKLPDDMPDLLGDDPGAAYAEAASALMDGWRALGALERTLPLPFADIPASVGINIYLMDQLIHTWDLARALGSEYLMDADLAEVALETVKQTLRPEFRGPGGPFGPEIACATDAPVQERLLAFTGRQPGALG